MKKCKFCGKIKHHEACCPEYKPSGPGYIGMKEDMIAPEKHLHKIIYDQEIECVITGASMHDNTITVKLPAGMSVNGIQLGNTITVTL